jgi:GalNAc-alpha-(1->4)-GalNAc-alpha-(1->3)-diNAcBac-PP-undecaprenol alpha-1,4-N-acetyl-D-galactosaminyltransferase
MTNDTSSRRIVLVSSSLSGGGAERIAVGMANWWAKAGRDVHFVTLRSDESAEAHGLSENVTTHHLRLVGKSNPPFDLRNSLRLWRLRRSLLCLKPDVIITFIEKLNIAVLAALVGSRIPIVATEHLVPWIRPISLSWRLLRAAAYRRAYAVVSPVESMTKWFVAHMRGNFITLRYPVNLDLKSPLPETRQPMILAAGRLAPEKGFDLLISAFAETSSENSLWQVEIIGEGPERSALQAQIADLGLNKRISLPGHVYDVEARMRKAGLFLMTSRTEAYPLVLCEALAAGLPIISSDCPIGPRELLDGGKKGVLVPANDSASLTRAMNEMMGDPGRRQRFSGAARRGAHLLTSDVVMPLWDALIEEASTTHS